MLEQRLREAALVEQRLSEAESATQQPDQLHQPQPHVVEEPQPPLQPPSPPEQQGGTMEESPLPLSSSASSLVAPARLAALQTTQRVDALLESIQAGDAGLAPDLVADKVCVECGQDNPLLAAACVACGASFTRLESAPREAAPVPHAPPARPSVGKTPRPLPPAPLPSAAPQPPASPRAHSATARPRRAAVLKPAAADAGARA